jgi:hypothetical protein
MNILTIRWNVADVEDPINIHRPKVFPKLDYFPL